MGTLVLVVVILMLLLSYVLYKAVFKHVFSLRKSILIWVRKLIAITDLSDQAKKSIEQDDIGQALNLYQDIFKLYKDPELQPTSKLNTFFANVSPSHTKYYSLAETMRQADKLNIQNFELISSTLGLSETYKLAGMVLMALQNEQVLVLSESFTYYRPQGVLPVNVGYLIAKADMDNGSTQEIAQINEALAALQTVPNPLGPANPLQINSLQANSLDQTNAAGQASVAGTTNADGQANVLADALAEASYTAWRFPADAMYLNFYFNQACDNNVAILLSLKRIWQYCRNEDNLDAEVVERECRDCAAFLTQVVSLQFQLFWRLGWHEMLPAQEEMSVPNSFYEVLETQGPAFEQLSQFLAAFVKGFDQLHS